MGCRDGRFQCLNRLCIFCGAEGEPAAEEQAVGFSALTGFVSSVGWRWSLDLRHFRIPSFSALTGFVSSVGLGWFLFVLLPNFVSVP